MTTSHRIDVTTDDGLAPCWVHEPIAEGKYPGVIMFPDAGSVRAAAHDMAERLAAAGFIVLLPQIFYREGEFAPFDAMTVFSDPPERERLMKMLKALDMGSAMRDAKHYIRTLREQPKLGGDRIGTTGYCFGGKLSFLTATAHPQDIGACAAFHAGGLVTDGADSPHLASDKIEATVYLGVADNDGSCTPEHQGALATALGKAHIDYTMELYKGAAHGFTMTDFPVYDETAAETHWERMIGLFESRLQTS